MLKRLRQVTLGEVRGRSAQAFAAFNERWGFSSLGSLPTDKELSSLSGFDDLRYLVDEFQSQLTKRFCAGLIDRNSTIAEFRRRWPEAEFELIRRADEVLSGKFQLLGLEDLILGETPSWHIEPLSGKRAPLVHWSSLDYLDAETAGDKKVIWELNRHQYFIWLGQAYWFTRDERYARHFVRHLESWMDENPPKLGINWASSLEVAFRSISWLWAFAFFIPSPSLESSTVLRAIKFLYLQARHIETYLSTYFSPNTHLTGEALGLYYLGTFMPGFTDAKRWSMTGRQLLLDQLSVHVQPDGVYFEQSSYYHRYTADFYLHFAILSRINGDELPTDARHSVRQLLDHLMYLTQPDGMTPLFGDDDGGRLMMLDTRQRNDFRPTLSTAAAVFDRPDYKFVAAQLAEETLWLLGSRGVRVFDSLDAREPNQTSVGFPNGGYYVMRDHWGDNSNYLLFDCGPHGMLNCGHAHADALAFELSAVGRSMLVDPGTFTYTGSRELRDWFRSSLAHNTLTIDRESSSIPRGPFSWASTATCRQRQWITRPSFDLVEGEHDGYERLASCHNRAILFLKNDFWIIRDRICVTRNHHADLWFHFDDSVSPLIEAADEHLAFVTAKNSDTTLDIYCFGGDGNWRREDGWISTRYGEKHKARVCAYSAKIDGDAEFITFLVPQRVDNPSHVRKVESVGGTAFEVTHSDSVDLVMIRRESRAETARVTSDFEWTWARFSPDGMLAKALLIGGCTLTIAGRPFVSVTGRANYVAIKQTRHGFEVDSDIEAALVHVSENEIAIDSFESDPVGES